tara:strand:+ start:12864 stop:13091 length:228 start_codon:yes stop_codon:yes gene_type:complete
MENKKPEVVVVYRKSARAKKRYMTVFTNHHVDDIIGVKRKPLIDNSYILDEVGVGESFIKNYKYFYGIEKHSTVN